MNLKMISNADLLTRVKHLAQRERVATAALIAHLAEIDKRRLYLAEGCSSMFTYCTQILHLSEHAAYGRIEAARLLRRFPIILNRLEDGSMNLTTVSLLAPHLTIENQTELLDTARHKTKRQVEDIVARLHPQPPIQPSVRRLPAARLAAEVLELAATTRSGSSSGSANPDPPTQSPAVQPRPSRVAPLSPQSYKVQFTASAKTVEKLRRAQALLRHQVPDGDPATVIDLALTALLENLAKKKLAAAERPRESRRPGLGSRHIPAAVKRAVWLRDEGRCAFVSSKGRRCSEDGFLEFHHITPFAAGGEATADNIQLRCRSHNGYEAALYFGRPSAPATRSGPSSGTAPARPAG